jgi:hypothetical protein
MLNTCNTEAETSFLSYYKTRFQMPEVFGNAGKYEVQKYGTALPDTNDESSLPLVPQNCLVICTLPTFPVQ